MNLERIASVVNRDVVGAATVCMVGCGAAVDLAVQLVRCGVRQFVLVDPDVVGAENLCRQGFDLADVGSAKVDAVARRLRHVNDAVDVCTIQQRFEAEASVSADLYLCLADSTAASLAVNRAALATRTPAIWAGVYPGGLAGEVALWRPGLPCYRCLFPGRTEVAERTPSVGVSIFDTAFIDAIVGQLALGLLGDEHSRFGRMAAALGDRNFLRVKIDPAYQFNGRDAVRTRLEVPPRNPHYFAWCTTAESDPQRGTPPCADCAEFDHQARVA